MERLPYPPPESYPPDLPSANMLRMWSHSPTTLRPGLALGTACISSLSIPGQLREVLTLYCAMKFQSGYIWTRHVEGAKRKGVAANQIQALRDRDIRNRQVWDEKEIAFLVFLDEVIDRPEVGDDTFSEAKKWFDDRQIVEIITAQGFYYMWSRVSTVLRVEIDAEVEGDYEKARQWSSQSS